MAILDFVKNRLIGNIIGFGAGTAAAQAFEPALRPIGYELENEFKNRVLSPAELAELVIRGERTLGDAAGEAGNSGINAERFRELTMLAGNPPGPSELIDLLNRGVIDDERFAEGIRQGRFRSEWLDSVKRLRDRLHTPGTVAEGVARGHLSAAQGRAEARAAGLSTERFELLEALALRPPALGEMLDLLNRGEVNQGAVTEALEDAGIRPEWRQRLLELRHVIPSVSDQIRFAVREVFSPEIRRRFQLDQDFPPEFARQAARVGLEAESARAYWAAHWELPSPQQGFAMFHRDIIKRPDLELLLRSLDVMPFWRDKIIDLAYLVPGRIDLRRMFEHGVIDEARVHRGYLDIGYNPEDADALTKFTVELAAAEDKSLAKGEITALYAAREITREDALTMLRGLGYSEQNAGFVLDIKDAQEARAFRNAVIAVVRRRYVDGEIDNATATARLDTIGVLPEARERLLDLWSFERAENPRHITEAQMRAAAKRGIVTPERYLQHLALLNYPEDEALILVELYAIGAAPAEQ